MNKMDSENINVNNKYTDKMVSVITPVYNASKHLNEMIQSVLNQTYKNIEIIFVDDCSTDNSAEIIKNYRNKYPMIRLFRTIKNRGPAIARNIGIKQARGRYIAFLDSDDIWKKDKIAMQLHLLDQNRGVPFTYTAINYINDDGIVIKKKRDVETRINYSYLLKNTAIATSSVLIDRYVVSEVIMPDRRSAEDYSLWLQLLKKYGDAFGINEDLVSYRKSGNSISHNRIGEVKYFFEVQTQDMNLEKLNAIWNTVCYIFNAVKKHYL